MPALCYASSVLAIHASQWLCGSETSRFPHKNHFGAPELLLPSSHSPTHTLSLSHQHSLFLFFSLSSSLFLPLPPFFPSICCICCILSTSVVSTMPLEARVKSVLSGDTVVLSHATNPGQERTLSLAYVSAPRLRREGDEVSFHSALIFLV